MESLNYIKLLLILHKNINYTGKNLMSDHVIFIYFDTLKSLHYVTIILSIKIV